MFHCMPFKIFNPLLAYPFAFFFVINIGKQLVHNAEKFLMFAVDNIDADIKPILPHKLILIHFDPPLSISSCSLSS